jgi:hypothetical protein
LYLLGHAMAKQTFKFPLEDDNGYKGRITFKTIKEAYKTLPETVFDGLVKTPQVDTTTLEGITQASRSSLYGNQKPTRGNLPFRDDLETRKAVLYLPGALQFQDNVEYTNVDLGIVGQAARNAMQNPNATGRAVLGAVTGNMMPDFQSIQDAFNMGLRSEGAQVAALRLTNKLSPEVQGAIETTTGIALNPNRRSTLRGIGVRQFRFTFKMIPESPEEAREVKQIVQFFREEMYPDTSDDALQAALRFPSKFQIRMEYDGKKVATNILPCFLANVDVVYNSTGMSFHTDGEFQETDLSLSFIEERALTKRDILAENQENAFTMADGFGVG